MMIEHLRGIDNLIVPFQSPSVIENPTYQERMFIKVHHNKQYLKKCSETGKFPTARGSKILDKNKCIDPEMQKLLELVNILKNKSKKPSEDELNFFGSWDLPLYLCSSMLTWPLCVISGNIVLEMN